MVGARRAWTHNVSSPRRGEHGWREPAFVKFEAGERGRRGNQRRRARPRPLPFGGRDGGGPAIGGRGKRPAKAPPNCQAPQILTMLSNTE